MALTIDEVTSAVPAHLRTAITPAFVDKLNNIASDENFAEEFERNFISYAKVLQTGRFKTHDYVNAVNYVTYKLLGHSNQDAYAFTFPDRIRDMTAKGYDKKRISSFVSNYANGQLVQAIMEQTMVPAFVLHQSKFHQAIGVLAEVALDPQALNKDRVAAADSLVRNLTPPQAKEVNINLGVAENSGMTEMKQQIAALAKQQKELIEHGGSVKAIAEAPLFEAKVIS